MNRKSLLILLVSLIMPAIFISCDIKNPTEGLAVIVQTITRQTTVIVNISDQNGANITSRLLVTFAGKDSAYVIDEVNNKLTSVTTDNGAVVFSMKDTRAISTSSPAALMLQIKAVNGDYLDVAFPVSLVKTGETRVYIKLVKKTEAQATGIDNVVKAPTTGNASPSTGTLTTPVSYSAPAGTNITIPQGSTLKDAQGAPLSGQISVSTTVYTPKAAGLLPVNEIVSGGKYYVPVMAFNFQITDQSGKVAASASGTDSKLSIPVTNIINPTTGAAYKAGDEIALFYVDAAGNVTSVGTFQVKSSLTAMSKTSGNSSVQDGLFANFPLSGLQGGGLPGASGFQSLTWSGGLGSGGFYGGGSGGFGGSGGSGGFGGFGGGGSIGGGSGGFGGGTQSTYTFNFGSGVQTGISLELEVTYTSGTTVRVPITGSSLTCPKLGFESSFIVKIAGSNIEVSQRLNASSITGNTASLNVSFANLTYFDVFVQGKCPNESANNPKRINPNITVSILKNNSSYGSITLTNGKGNIYLPDGEYTLTATYDHTAYSTTATVAQRRVTIRGNANVQEMNDQNKPQAGSSGPVYLWYYILTSRAC